MAKLTVIIPCFNEAQNIPLLLQRFAAVLKRPDVELLLVDNGSTDGTDKILSELLPAYSFASSYRVSVNQGYGYGILQGLAQTSAEFIGWTHADMQTDPSDVLKALDIIEEQGAKPTVYVKGLRRGRRLVDEIFTTGMSIFETVLLGVRLWDINAQPNIFHRSFFETWIDPPHDFSLDLFGLYQARVQGLQVIRYDVRFTKRIHGQSKWNTGFTSRMKFIKRTVVYSLALKRNLRSY